MEPVPSERARNLREACSRSSDEGAFVRNAPSPSPRGQAERESSPAHLGLVLIARSRGWSKAAEAPCSRPLNPIPIANQETLPAARAFNRRINPSRIHRSIMDVKLTAVFKKVPEGYIGFVQELPGANTQGRTLEEARANLQEAIAMVLEANRELAEEEIQGEEVIREKIPLSAA